MGYSNGLLESEVKGGSGERGEQGLPGIGFKLTDDGNFDIDGKRLTDVSQPVDSRDATTKAYVDGEIGHHTGNFYHLRQSFTFYDSSGTELALSTDSITGLVTDYKHGYYKIPKSGDDNYFSTLDIKIRNNLPQSTYSALFYLYGYRNNSIMSGVDLGPILFGVDGTNYNILKYDDDDSPQTRNHTKGIIWFTSDGSAGSIELGLRFFDKSITHFVILSRCVEGKVNLGFSSNIFNVSSTVGDVTLYFEDINMNSRKIKNLGGPTDDGDVTNKKHVDTENAKQDIAINSKLDKTGGSMTGDLDMADNKIINLKDIDQSNENHIFKRALNYGDIINYIESYISYLTNVIYLGTIRIGPGSLENHPFSYVMTSFNHNNEKEFIFSPNIRSRIAVYDSSMIKNLIIIKEGRYIIIYRDMFKNKGKVKFEISSILGSTTYQTIYSDEIDFNTWTTKTISIELYVDNISTSLSISATDSLLLDGRGAENPLFGLFLITDVLNKREAANTYLKLDGSKPMTGDLDIGNKNILKVENLVDYKDTDPYDYRVKDVKSVVNKEYLNENFIKKVDKDGREYYDLKGNIIRNCEPYNDRLFTDNDLVSKKYVDNENAKQDIAINNISTISSYNINLITA